MPNTTGSGRTAATVRLSEVPVGRTVRVVAITASGHGLESRLEHVGFLPGTPVVVERRAPLGDPTVYELRGYRLGLRRESAELVEVELVEATEVAP